jgi:hypothetical protein
VVQRPGTIFVSQSLDNEEPGTLAHYTTPISLQTVSGPITTTLERDKITVKTAHGSYSIDLSPGDQFVVNPVKRIIRKVDGAGRKAFKVNTLIENEEFVSVVKSDGEKNSLVNYFRGQEMEDRDLDELGVKFDLVDDTFVVRIQGKEYAREKVVLGDLVTVCIKGNTTEKVWLDEVGQHGLLVLKCSIGTLFLLATTI